MPGVAPVRSERQPAPRNGVPPEPGQGGRPEGRLHISQLFLPGVFERIERWRADAEAAMRAVKAGRRARPPATLTITEDELRAEMMKNTDKEEI